MWWVKPVHQSPIYSCEMYAARKFGKRGSPPAMCAVATSWPIITWWVSVMRNWHFGIKSDISLQWRHNERDGVSKHQRLGVCPTVGSGTNRTKHHSSASLAFVRGIHRWPIDFPHKCGTYYYLMTSSCYAITICTIAIICYSIGQEIIGHVTLPPLLSLLSWYHIFYTVTPNTMERGKSQVYVKTFKVLQTY